MGYPDGFDNCFCHHLGIDAKRMEGRTQKSVRPDGFVLGHHYRLLIYDWDQRIGVGKHGAGSVGQGAWGMGLGDRGFDSAQPPKEGMKI